MAKDGIEIKGLERWEAWLKTLPNERVERYKDRVLRTAGLRTLEYLHDLTPVRTSRLAGSFTAGGKDGIYEIKINQGTSYARVGTAVPYVTWVNDGYTQKAGQFVPGKWSSGNFHYDPDAKGGMVLTGKEVPGAHMFEKSLQYMEEDIPQIMEFELRRLWAEVNRG